MTIRAPSASGRVNSGVAAVESTATTAPTSRAIAPTAAMSVMSQVGLAGVSIQISCGGRARAFCARSSIESFSYSSIAKPQGTAKSSSHLRSAQYMRFGASARCPGPSAWNTAAAAAWPDENTIAEAAPSKAAISASVLS